MEKIQYHEEKGHFNEIEFLWNLLEEIIKNRQKRHTFSGLIKNLLFEISFYSLEIRVDFFEF